MNDIAVAVACYNNEDEVLEFARKLSHQNQIEKIQLLVTCNACKDFEQFGNDIKSILPTAQVFDAGSNLGYLSGCLYGVKKTKIPYSWIMVSNTDIDFPQDNFFEKALNKVPENVWCIGPNIVLSATGAQQNPFLKSRPSNKKVNTWRIAYSNYFFFRLYQKLHKLKIKKKIQSPRSSGEVYAVHGSCFFLRNECVQKIIEENSNIFMYGEELLIAEIVRENAKCSFYNSEVSIYHNENQVTGKVASKRKQQWFKASISYLYSRFYKK